MQNKWNPALGKTIGMPIATVPQDPGLQLMTLCNTSHVTSTGWHLSPSATKVMESHDERLLLQANIGRIWKSTSTLRQLPNSTTTQADLGTAIAEMYRFLRYPLRYPRQRTETESSRQSHLWLPQKRERDSGRKWRHHTHTCTSHTLCTPNPLYPGPAPLSKASSKAFIPTAFSCKVCLFKIRCNFCCEPSQITSKWPTGGQSPIVHDPWKNSGSKSTNPRLLHGWFKWSSTVPIALPVLVYQFQNPSAPLAPLANGRFSKSSPCHLVLVWMSTRWLACWHEKPDAQWHLMALKLDHHASRRTYINYVDWGKWARDYAHQKLSPSIAHICPYLPDIGHGLKGSEQGLRHTSMPWLGG